MGCIKHSNQKQTCLFADRLFLACLFVVRLMYRACIAKMPFSHFFEHCFSDKKSKQVTIQNACVSCLFVFRLVLLLCVFALLACSNRKHRNQKHTCLFADRLFLGGLFLVRLMYRVCIANMPFRHFLEH